MALSVEAGVNISRRSIPNIIGRLILNYEKFSGSLSRICVRLRKCKRDFLGGESGSISVMIIGLAVFALTLSVGILDLSDAFLARRELIQISEEATQRAAHEISLPDYYSGQFEASNSFQVPLDCANALRSVGDTIGNSHLRGNSIEIKESTCDGHSIEILLGSTIKPIVNFPIINSLFGGRLVISARTSAASIVPST